MIPILYDENEISFLSNGICRLSDIISCKVTEERNGVYECEFTYPVSGLYFSEITEGRIIACYHDDTKTIQPFDIYSRSQPLNGAVTFYAHHISYRLSKSVLKPFTASSCSQVFNILEDGDIFMNRGRTFSFWTDKQVNGAFKLDVPKSVREVLGGSEGSILDTYGKGEYLFDKFAVYLYLNRGVDNNVTICYGKNLTEFRYDSDLSGCYEAVAPYWKGTTYEDDVETSVVVTLPEGYVGAYGMDIPSADAVTVSPLDLSQYFDKPPTKLKLRAKAKSLLTKSEAWLIKESFDVSFARLWESGDYETYASLQRVNLCDYVTVVNPNVTGIEFKMEVIKVVYDVIEERYKSMELGSPKKNFADTVTEDIMTATDDLIKSLPNKSYMQSAIDYATKLIAGGLGGHVILKTNADGQPEEILIMDTDDPQTAVNVWRFNLNGLGHSHSGYDGPFSDIALTMDGRINATMITTGVLNAGIIRAGILSDVLGNNWWNLDTGEFHLSAQSLKNMSVGGTNLVRKTRDMPLLGDIKWAYVSESEMQVSPDDDGFYTAVLDGVNCELCGPTGKRIGDYLGKNILVSFDVEPTSSNDIDNLKIFISLSPDQFGTGFHTGYIRIIIPATTFVLNEKKRISVSFLPVDASSFIMFSGKTFSENQYFSIRITSSGTPHGLKISRIKAEVGLVATDWSPAPEDDENAIQEIHSQYSTLSNTVNGIQTEVGRIDQDMDSFSADVSSISQRADEISTEVSKKVGKSEVISRINQSAEQVKIDANKITFAGKTVNFSTTEINLSNPENADTCYFGDDEDIIIIPEVDDKPVRPIRIGGGLGYLRFGCTDARSLVEIFSGNNLIAIGNYSIGSGTNNVFRIQADQRLELMCGDYSIVLTNSGINLTGPNGILDTWS